MTFTPTPKAHIDLQPGFNFVGDNDTFSPGWTEADFNAAGGTIVDAGGAYYEISVGGEYFGVEHFGDINAALVWDTPTVEFHNDPAAVAAAIATQEAQGVQDFTSHAQQQLDALNAPSSFGFSTIQNVGMIEAKPNKPGIQAIGQYLTAQGRPVIDRPQATDDAITGTSAPAAGPAATINASQGASSFYFGHADAEQAMADGFSSDEIVDFMNNNLDLLHYNNSAGKGGLYDQFSGNRVTILEGASEDFFGHEDMEANLGAGVTYTEMQTFLDAHSYTLRGNNQMGGGGVYDTIATMAATETII